MIANDQLNLNNPKNTYLINVNIISSHAFFIEYL